MKITFICKQTKASDNLKTLISKKISKLDKFFLDETEAYVTLSRYRDSDVLELTISYAGTLFRSEVKDETFYHAMNGY